MPQNLLFQQKYKNDSRIYANERTKKNCYIYNNDRLQTAVRDCLNDIWQHYISEQERSFNEPFDDEEKDINEYDDKLLQEIAWDYILKNPDKYRVGEPDLDNEDILDWNVFDEVTK